MKKAAALSSKVSANGEKEKKRERKREREGIRNGKGDCDEVVKSVGRLKIIQGSALRADALAALTCPHLSAYYVPITSRYLADPEEHGSTEDSSRGLWNRLSSRHIPQKLRHGQNGTHRASKLHTTDVSFHATTY